MFDPEKWAVWEYRATIVNDGVNSGNHDYRIIPGAGNMAILLGGQLLNGDTTGRTATVQLLDTDNAIIRRLISARPVGAGSRREFPKSEVTADDREASDGSPMVVAGVEDLLVSIASLAINENTELSIQMLVSGGVPSVVLISPTDAVETVTTDVVV